jgi:nucleotide-binding universal stress UspA family protein
MTAMPKNTLRKIEHILFPIDFSERCCNVVPFVAAMARRYCAKITLLGVVQPFYYAAMGDPGAAVVVNLEELLQDLKTRLDGSLLQEFEGLCVERVAMLGDPAQVITAFAHTQGVDLIMMPTHGYGPFRRLLLGSVTAKVLHDAECPVWTAVHMAKAPHRVHSAFSNILCAVDGKPDCVSLIRWASEFSKDEGASLRLAHVVPETEPDLDGARESVGRLAASAGVDAPICVSAGHVVDTICQEALRHDSDLIVIGRGVLHERLGRLRTHAHAIIRESPCPVLSV